MPAMIDEDLSNIRRMLGHMDGDAEIRIGQALVSAAELLSVFDEALRARRAAKMGDVPDGPDWLGVGEERRLAR